MFPLSNDQGHETTASVLSFAIGLLATRIKKSRRSFINIFDQWSLMGVFLYVEEVAMIYAHSIILGVS